MSSLETTIKALEALPAEVSGIQTTTKSLEGLPAKLSSQCAAINEVTNHANQLTSGVSELTGALNLILGGFLPALPETSKGVSC